MQSSLLFSRLVVNPHTAVVLPRNDNGFRQRGRHYGGNERIWGTYGLADRHDDM